MSIVAHNSDYIMRIRWQKVIFAYYSWGGKRTFTLGNGTSLNLRSYIRVSNKSCFIEEFKFII